MARLKVLLAFLALLFCAAGIGGSYYYWKKFAEPDMAVTRQIEGKDPSTHEGFDIGKRHFDAAMELLRQGEMISARDRLLYVMQYFPESKTYTEAKRIVGEVNMDLLLSELPMPGKVEYVVKSGDALVRIARNAKTTIDYIMRVNGKTNPLIYPNESLLVFPLAYRVEVDLKKKTVTVFDEDKFFKEYAIVDQHLPPDIKAPIKTTISEKVAWDGDRPLNFSDENYMACSKWLRTAKIGLFIRRADPDGPQGANRPFGVMVSPSDMEELFTIMANGSEFAVVN